MSAWAERNSISLDEAVESFAPRIVSDGNRRRSQIVQALLDDEGAKPKVQEFIQELEGNGTIELLQDLITSWDDLRTGFRRQSNGGDGQDRGHAGIADVDQALVNINQHLSDRNSKHRMSIPLADQSLLPGAIPEENAEDRQETQAGTKVKPKATPELMKNPSFKRFFNTVSTANLHPGIRKDVEDDFATLPPSHSETMTRLSYRNFGPVRLFFVGNIEIPMDNKSRYSHLFLHPEAKARRPWNFFMTFSITYFTIMLPLRIAFEAAMSSHSGLLAFEAFLDVCYLMEIVMNFLTVDVNSSHQGRIIYDFRVIARKYWSSWFIWDLLSIIPFDITSNSISATHFFRLVKLVRMIRVIRLFRLSKYMSDYHSGSRIIKSLVLLIAAAHILTCFWIYIMHFEQDENGLSWLDFYPVPMPTGASQYVTALYFVVATMGTVGFGDVVPSTTTEKVYTTVLMVFSVTMFAYFIGNISSILSGWGSTDAGFKGHIRNLKLFMEKEDLPKDMRSRLLAYHDYCYKRYGTFPFSEPSVTDDLSPALKAEVAAFLNKDLTNHVPVLKGLRQDIVKAVLQVLKHEIYGPHDIIMHEGDVGMEMYFLTKGRALVSWKGAIHTHKKILREGALFGEMAVLLGFKRTATVTALGFCEVCVLTNEMFDKLILNAPDFAAWIRNLVVEQNYQFRQSLQEEIESRWARFSKIVDDLQLTKFEAIKYNNSSVMETSLTNESRLDSKHRVHSRWRILRTAIQATRRLNNRSKLVHCIGRTAPCALPTGCRRSFWLGALETSTAVRLEDHTVVASSRTGSTQLSSLDQMTKDREGFSSGLIEVIPIWGAWMCPHI